MNLKCILLRERSQCENVTHCISNHMTFWERQNYVDSKKTVFARGGSGGVGKRNKQITKHFKGSANALYHAII